MPRKSGPPLLVPTPGDLWILEFVDLESRRLTRLPVAPLPFRIGRAPGLELTLKTPEVSSAHATIEIGSDGLTVRDLGSTNGTFVNRQPVSSATPLADGDILHFASQEFRVRKANALESAQITAPATTRVSLDFSDLLSHADGLVQLLERGSVISAFQPIVRFDDGAIVAVEALGRGAQPGLPREPMRLFEIAAKINAELDLAAAFRRQAVAAARGAKLDIPLFLNAHPDELASEAFLQDFARLAAESPELKLVLEISEHFAAPIDELKALSERLRAAGVGIAYDDFGAGMARIEEMSEAPADYLKLDATLVRRIDAAPPAKRRLLGALVAAARELGMEVIAEGVETEAEAAACIDLGAPLAQGFLYGQPGPLLDALRAPKPRDA
ncbi:MAG: EAL domain-containing protein [Holophagales bacterium]|nr:EAL domain-containing protein [Holophagales bacterium]